MFRRILSAAVVSGLLSFAPGTLHAQGTGVGDAAAVAGVVVSVIGGLSTWIGGIQDECAAAGLGAAWGKDCGLKQEECTDTGIFYADCSATASNGCGWALGGGHAWEGLYGMWSGYGISPWAYAIAMPLHGECDTHSAKAWGKASVDGTSRASTVDTTGAPVVHGFSPSSGPRPAPVWPPGTVLVTAKIDTLKLTRSPGNPGGSDFKGSLRVNGNLVWSVTARINASGTVTTTGPLSAAQFSVGQNGSGDWVAMLTGYNFEYPVDTLYVPGAPGSLRPLSAGGETSTDVSVSMETETSADASEGSSGVCTGPTLTQCSDCYLTNADGSYVYDGATVTFAQPLTILASSLSTQYLDTYLRDASGTVRILDPFQGPGAWTAGDRVQVRGELTLFEGEPVLTRVTLTKAGVEPVPVPKPITTRDLFDNLSGYQGQLVTVGGVTVLDPENWPKAGQSGAVKLTDGRRMLALEISGATDAAGSDAPAGFVNATGILEAGRQDAVPVGETATTSPAPRLRLRSRADLAAGREVIVVAGPPADGAKLRLSQNEPNPFNPVTAISFGLEQAGPVTLRIFSVSGRLVRTLADAPMAAGTHEFLWDGADDAGAPLPSGIYLYRIDHGGEHRTRKMIMSK